MRNPPSELGELVESFSGHQWKRKDLLCLLLGLLACVGPLIYSGWFFRNDIVEYGLMTAFFRAQPFILMAYLAFLFLSSWTAYRILAGKRFVEIYQNGIRWRLKGIRSNQLTWADIKGIACATTERIFFTKTIGEEHQAILYCTNGTGVLLGDQVENFQNMISTIKRQYYPTILPQLLTSFQDGKQLRFGPVAIQKTCLYIAKSISAEDFPSRSYQPKAMQVLSWSELSGLTVTSGFLMVKSVNSRIRKIPVSQIPNFEILLKIVEQGVNL